MQQKMMAIFDNTIVLCEIFSGHLIVDLLLSKPESATVAIPIALALFKTRNIFSEFPDDEIVISKSFSPIASI